MIGFMKSAAPSLLPLLRSRAQGDIIAWIFLHPDQEFSLVEIAQQVDVSSATVMREVDRLFDAGLISEVRRGNTRLVKAAQDNPVFQPLADLMAVTFGPVPILSELLADVVGIDEAFIYGSFADRYQGSPGHVPRDLDVLVIGKVSRDAVFDVEDVASRRLGREVNIKSAKAKSWFDMSTSDPFRTTVLSRPQIPLVARKVRVA